MMSKLITTDVESVQIEFEDVTPKITLPKFRRGRNQ